MDTMKRRGLLRFWDKWLWIRDVSYLAQSKCEGVCDFFLKLGSFWIGGVCQFYLNIRGVSGVMWWPGANTNSLLVGSGDFEFRVGDKGI
jgi:hypothetical protein